MRPSSEYWSELYAMHSPSLREFVATRVPAPEVDDLLQDVWASLARTLEDQDIEQPRAWIYRVARNRIADLYRRRGSQPVLQDVTDELAQPQESTSLVGRELAEEIQEALALLPPKQREVFVRNELGGTRSSRRRRPQYGPRRPKHNVPVNIAETETGFTAQVFCVGFPKEQVRVTVTNNHIYISGRRQPADDQPDFLLQEYPIKSFERWFELSDGVDQSAITARFEDGVLHIEAPKTEAARSPEREVPIA